MKRDLRALADRRWDVAVIGGGIHGAWVAWDAVLRGLTVCLVDQADFASATSANTMKIIHGGLRYLQHADVCRMRASLREQRTLLRIAPYLVEPLPVLVPTYGRGWRGRPALRAALALNDVVALGHGGGIEHDRRIPRGRTISRRDCLRLVPNLQAAAVTGAGIFYDAQVRNSERLVVAILRSAAKAGAELANYAEVTALRHHADGLVAIDVTDRVDDERIVVRARTVVNAAGPWVGHVRRRAWGGTPPDASFAKAFNVVTRRLFPTDHAVALPMPSACKADCGGGGRSLFVVPWRGRSLVGTWYERYDGAPDELRITEREITRLLGSINAACPALGVTLDDVCLVHAGLLPVTRARDDAAEPTLATRGRIVDHAADGVPGLLSVVGVKYTTARLMAEQVVDRVFARLGGAAPRCVTASAALHGGEPGAAAAVPDTLRDYGNAAGDVLAHMEPGERAEDPLAILRAEVRHAIRDEMALTLSDVVFRRTALGTAGAPEPERLHAAARVATTELGWPAHRERAELQQVYGRFDVPR